MQLGMDKHKDATTQTTSKNKIKEEEGTRQHSTEHDQGTVS
jgi:hypothetical protein